MPTVGVNIQKYDNSSYEFTQCALIDSNIEDISLTYAKTTTKPVKADVQKPLHAFEDSPYFNNKFNSYSVVGKLNYNAQTTWPDIIYAVYSCVHLLSDPCQDHGIAIISGQVVTEDFF